MPGRPPNDCVPQPVIRQGSATACRMASRIQRGSRLSGTASGSPSVGRTISSMRDSPAPPWLAQAPIATRAGSGLRGGVGGTRSQENGKRSATFAPLAFGQSESVMLCVKRLLNSSAGRSS